jgi:lipoprotein-anchoring transpeptidase ErfK/SrfK
VTNRPSFTRKLYGCITAVASAGLLSGCAPGVATGPAAAPSPTSTRSGFVRATHVPVAPVFPAFSAIARVRSVVVRTSPDGRARVTLANPQPSGAPLVFLVVAHHGPWVQVQLPVRPNGSTGWVRASEVTLAGVAYRLDLHRAAHRLDVYRFDSLERSYPVGIGTSETPTPGGTFYLKELLRPPTTTGPYGPYAYGLSGFSNTLRSFAGGDGVIGIHGTDHPELVGKDVSHGCIRMRNADITALTKVLPLGTPVRVLA